MRRARGNLFAEKFQAVALPSSAYIQYNGVSRTGQFVGKFGEEVEKYHRGVSRELGKHISQHGNFVIKLTGGNIQRQPHIGENPLIKGRPHFHLLNFPVKPGKIYLEEDGIETLEEKYQKRDFPKNARLPGHMAKPRWSIIEASLKELEELTVKLKTVAIPAFEDETLNERLLKKLSNKYTLYYHER